MTLVFASGNLNKTAEIQSKLEGFAEIKSLKDFDFHEDIPETALTFQGNALIKAQFCKEKFGFDCFADDSGLEVDILNGKPGVFSARYAGPQKNDLDNLNLLLYNMTEETNRLAQFKTVIALIWKNETHFFEGVIRGTLTLEPIGDDGFGYDPIFIPEGYDRTFAQMTKEEKNKISHRAIAVEKMVQFIQTNR
jgi:XTP/dITP diphosphohydrolase